jgi:hypothetical protein
VIQDLKTKILYLNHTGKMLFIRAQINWSSTGSGCGANSLCGYILCGDHCREITTAQENHNGCGEV